MKLESKLQNFCWNWFEQSGNPKAYMEYLKTKKNEHKNHEDF